MESPAQQLVREPKLVQEVVATEKFRAGPFVRRIAHEMGLDLAKISGTGSSKQITPKDIRAFLSAQNIEEDADLSKYVYEVQSFGVVDASAAKQLTKSWQTVPMVTHHQYIDITDLEELRQAHKAKCEQMGVN